MSLKQKLIHSQSANNITMLYIMNITQIILPLLTLPYLTRVLSLTSYGLVSYVKNVMIYVTIIIEFGYLLSGTREIAGAKTKDEMGRIIGKITVAKLFLALLAFIVLLIMIGTINILRAHIGFVLLMFVPQVLAIFLFDYFFRGIEKMQVVTIRFLIMRGTSTILTFIFIKGNQNIMLIPVLDIVGTLLAVLWINWELHKMQIKLSFVSFAAVFRSIKLSAIYLLSNIASTIFGAFNVIVVGATLSAKNVAFWTLLMTIVAGVQQLYTPIADGIYPRMIKVKSLKLFKNILLIFTPLVITGCLVVFFSAKYILLLIAGHKYLAMVNLLKLAVPLLLISFYSSLCGWPLLGAIDKVKETTTTTVIAAISQIAGVGLLLLFGQFNLYSLLMLRICSEAILALLRISYAVKFKSQYVN